MALYEKKCRLIIMENKEFRWGSFIKAIMVIAIPVALQNLLSTTGSMVDTIMLAALGETTVGAVGLCAQDSSCCRYCICVYELFV